MRRTSKEKFAAYVEESLEGKGGIKSPCLSD